MSLWRHLTHGLRALRDAEEADRDVADEVDHYLDEATAALIAEGLSPEEARRRARRELGRESALRREVRAYGWENTVQGLFEDLELAARRIRKHPGVPVVSVLTLALGIGATTAIFSVASPILFEPLPYPESGRIVSIADRAPDGSTVPVTFGSFRELSERGRSFESLAVVRPWLPTLTGTGEPERLTGQRVSAAYFDVLGVPPALGRGFDPADDRAGGPRVAILTDGLWRTRFGADPAIVGRPITLDDEPFTVVGVMAPEFENVTAPASQLWTLLQYDASLPSFDTREWGHHLAMVGRLGGPGRPAAAASELDAITGDPIPEFPRPPWASMGSGLVIEPLRDTVTRTARPALYAMLGAVVLLLLITCVNVTNLLLARGGRQRGEFAVRAALGARRPRLIRQVLTESLVLAVLGGVAGVLLAVWGVQSLLALVPADLPRLAAVRVDGSVLLAALGVTTLVGTGVGLMPALQATRADPQEGLWETARRTVGGHRFARKALVVAEVSLTLVLLVGAGLLLRSLNRLFTVDPGFDPSGRIALQVQASGQDFDDDRTRRFFADALESVRAVPGVATAGLTSQLPLSGEEDVYGVQAEGGLPAGPDEDQGALRYTVTPGYLEAMGVPLRAGRALGAADHAGAPPGALVSESLARRLFGEEDPVGRRIHIGRTDLPWYTIVGVTGDVKQVSLAGDRAEAAYVTPSQWYFADAAMWLVAETRQEPGAIVPAIKSAIWSVDENRPIVRVAEMEEIVAASAAERRFALHVFRAFALASLLLAGIGLYGVLAAGVSDRRRELGLRSTLGASRGDLVGLVVRQGAVLAGLGAIIGLVAALALSRTLSTLLYEISPLDAVTYVGVVVVLGAIAAVSCALPAWRAARVDPSIALRAD